MPMEILGFEPKVNFKNHVAIVDGKEAIALFGPLDSRSMRNAKRFLACVNAFEGVDDDDIEKAIMVIRRLFQK